MEPPVSDPMVTVHWPEAAAEPEPPLDPPGIRFTSQGLCMLP